MRRSLSFLLLCLSGIAAAQSRNFGSPTLLRTASDPAALTTGDWNRDGNVDIAYIDSGSTPSLHILLGKGDGTFTEGAPLTLPVGTCTLANSVHACMMQQGDFNGDGLPDFIVESSPSQTLTLLTLLSNGDGSFRTGGTAIFLLNTTTPSDPVTLPMAVADFTGDGKADVAVADFYGNQLYYAAGSGSGGFNTLSVISLSTYGMIAPGGAIAGDFNHDGNPDIAMLGAFNFNTAGVQILYGDGKGNLSKGPQYPGTVNQPILVDVNGDGIPDLLGMSNSVVSYLPGLSGGGFGASQTLTNLTDLPLLLADVTGDGIPDIVTSSPTGIAIAAGKSGGSYAAELDLLSASASRNTTAAGDFNRDGNVDVAVGGAGGILIVFGSPSFRAASNFFASGGISLGNLLAGDFNGDGKMDVVAIQPGNGTNSANVVEMNGDGAGNLAEGSSTTVAAVSSQTGYGVAVDFDGDGISDIAMSSSPLEVLYGNKDGTFTGVMPLSTQGATTLFSGDVNHDGRPDLVSLATGFNSNTYSIYGILVSMINGGANRTFTAVQTNLPPTFTYPTLAAVGDVNGDGIADAVLADGSLPGFRVYLSNGDGTFRAGPSTTVPASVYNSSYLPTLIDIDGDGHADLVGTIQVTNTLTASTGAQVLILYGDGTGAFGTSQSVPLERLYTADLKFADINKDGLPDLLLSDGRLLSTVLNLGKRTFGGETTWLAGTSNAAFAVADMNADGYADLVAGTSKGLLVTLLNTASTGQANLPLQGAITATPSLVNYNQSILLSAGFTSATGHAPPSGAVVFLLDGSVLGTATLANGQASWTVPASVTKGLSQGAHAITVTFSGDGVYAAGVVSGGFTVQPPVYATSTTLKVSPTAITAGQFTTLTATVTADVAVTLGTVTFYDGATLLGQVNIGTGYIGAAGVASLQINLFTSGTHQLTAVYDGVSVPASYAYSARTFQASTSPVVTLSVGAYATSTTLSASSTTVSSGSVVTLAARVTASASASTPYGAVTFSDGNSVLGTVPLDSTGSATWSTASLTTGSHPLTATYNGTNPFSPSSSTLSIVTVKLSSLPAPVAALSLMPGASSGTVHLRAQVAGLSSAPVSGSVTFLAGHKVLGIAAVSAQGVATMDVTLASGAATVFQASFGGSGKLAPAASPEMQSSGYGTESNFSLAEAETATIASSGEPIDIAVGAIHGWHDTVSFRCAEVPAGDTCVFAPPTLLGSGRVSLRVVPEGWSLVPLAPIILAFICIPVITGRRRRLSVTMVAAGMVLLFSAGCGQATRGPLSAPFVVTVEATSGTTVQSIQVVMR